MEILELKPAVKDYIWGGTRLRDEYGKDAGGSGRVAETWELSLHPDGESAVAGGRYAGKTLRAVLDGWGYEQAAGTNAARYPMFPTLIKLIDARDSLSIQVHPADAYALKNENQYGKTEVWYVVSAEKGAGVYWGFKERISKERFRACIENGTVTDVLKFREALPGDVFFIEAGTVHAICKGLTIAEIQQNSNCTYRVYDYGRLGADGNPRPLHIEKALDVAVTAPPAYEKLSAGGAKGASEAENGEDSGSSGAAGKRAIADSEYFKVTEYAVETPLRLFSGAESYNAVLFLSGAGQITHGAQTLPYGKGKTFFVPAGLGDYEVIPAKASGAEKTKLLLTKV